jgi:hypothetical protein
MSKIIIGLRFAYKLQRGGDYSSSTLLILIGRVRNGPAFFDGLVKSRLTGENRCPVFS